MSERQEGTVKFYNERKNFGFIAGEDGTDYFVHASELDEGVTLFEDDHVSFEAEDSDRGPKAINVAKEE